MLSKVTKAVNVSESHFIGHKYLNVVCLGPLLDMQIYWYHNSCFFSISKLQAQAYG